MIRHLSVGAAVLSAALVLSPGGAMAQQTDPERLETAAEAIADEMFALMAAEHPGLAGSMPEASWDTAHRKAGACVLDRLRAETSDANIDRMLAEMETLAASDFDSVAALRAANANTHPGLPQERMIEINRECGMQAAMMQSMRESGLLDALRGTQPGG
jgi:hypothetical protein